MDTSQLPPKILETTSHGSEKHACDVASRGVAATARVATKCRWSEALSSLVCSLVRRRAHTAMNLSLDLAPEDGSEGGLGNGLASPMGGKHQRDLSLSAKWANNKALALEYLKRQREAILWIESVLDRKLPTRDLFEALKSGIVLRELIAKLYPEPTQCRSPISRRYSLTMAPWKERENITVFLKHCKSLGMNDCFLFCTDDLYEGTNMVQVLFSVQHFMAFSQEKSSHLFKPIIQEAVTFSNQELEMAMSKIEQAGVDVNALLSSAPPSTAPSPAKPQTEQDERESDDTPSTASSEEDIDHVEEKADSNEVSESSEDFVVSAKANFEPEEDHHILSDGVGALEVSQSELPDHKNNNSDESNDDSVEELVGALCFSHEEIVAEEEGCIQNERDSRSETKGDGEDAIQEIDLHEHDFERKSKLTTVEDEQLTTVEDELEILLNPEKAQGFGGDKNGIITIVSEAINENIVLLEVVGEIIDRVEIYTEAAIGTASKTLELLLPDDFEFAHAESATMSELTDKHDTYVGDSLAPTVIDTQATAETEISGNKFARASQAAKKVSKAGKGINREVLDEQLDAEAMSKCTCGGKCSIM